MLHDTSKPPCGAVLLFPAKAKEEKKQNELKTLVSAFTEFYKQVYKVNDFSFASIASENTKDTKKEVLTKGLQIVKNFK